jgi:heptaprenyl diphosphate synthase
VKSMREPTKSLKTVAFFGAICLFLSTVELMIPKPIPFLRLGLANIPILLALYLFSPREFFLLVLLKILGHGLIHGTLFSYIFLFSASGTMVSAAVMFLMYKTGSKRITLPGISVLGAFTSNIIQLILARFFIFGEGTWLIAPPFLIVGLVSGFLLGVLSERIYENSEWIGVIRR